MAMTPNTTADEESTIECRSPLDVRTDIDTAGVNDRDVVHNYSATCTLCYASNYLPIVARPNDIRYSSNFRASTTVTKCCVFVRSVHYYISETLLRLQDFHVVCIMFFPNSTSLTHLNNFLTSELADLAN